MLRDWTSAPTTAPQLRDAAAEELSDAIVHLNRAANYILALSHAAPEMSRARHDRERMVAQIERMVTQIRNSRTHIQQGA